MKPEYDFLIVGAGLYGSVTANRMLSEGKRCLVLEKRGHIGGNVYTQYINGIAVHKYGAHIFHTNNEEVWEYVRRFGRFNNFVNAPIANYNGEIYNLPFNMNTFSRMWGISRPDEAMEIIRTQIEENYAENPSNLEEQALNLVGRDVYEKLIKGYTEKQWGRPCTELPSFIIKRLPVRFTYDNNYFNASYQGIPSDGYTKLIEGMLEGADIVLNTDYLEDREKWNSKAAHVVYTGPIDAFFDYSKGILEYRSLDFKTEILDTPNFQGNAVVNYTDAQTPYTRIIEHKHFDKTDSTDTVVSYEYSREWTLGIEPYYPVNDTRNNHLYEEYREMAAGFKDISFGGRLAEYRYYDMDKIVELALSRSGLLLEKSVS